MTIANYRVVGALALPEGKAPFDRAPLILASEEEPGRLLQVTAYLEGGEPDGKAFAQEDFQALLQSGQAIAFGKPFEASSGVALWVLRRNFAGREAALEELRASELMLRDYLPLLDGSFGCLVRERPAALELRDRWAAQADAEARRHAAEGDWATAQTAATRAFALERAMSPERIAMLVLVYKRQGLATRAEGYLQMARRSRGEAFAAQTGYIVAICKLGKPASPAVQANAHYVWGNRLQPLPLAQTVRKSFALAHLESRSDFKDGEDSYRLLWRKHLHGREWSAARNLLLGGRKAQEAPAMRLLWLAISAEITEHPDALSELEGHLVIGWSDWLALDPLLRLVTRLGDFARAEQLAREFCKRNQQPDWMLQRMLVEAGLAAPKKEGAQTLERLAALLKDEQLPAKDRSELIFNLAAAELEESGHDHELLHNRAYYSAIEEYEGLMAEGDSDQTHIDPDDAPQGEFWPTVS